MTKHWELSSAKTGMMPGSAVYVGESPPEPTLVTVHIYDKDQYEILDNYDGAVVREMLANKKRVWIDVSGLANASLIATMGQDFSLHPLLVEDILNTHQRAKLDVYDDFLFLVFKLLDTPSGELTYSTEQFSMVVRPDLLLTFRESTDYNFLSLYHKLDNEHSLIREQGCDYLAYLIMDSIVDDYFNYVEEAGLAIEAMEDLLISNPESIKLDELYTIKRRTLTLRKTIAPIRDIIHIILTDKSNMIEPKYTLYFRDLHDHSIRLMQQIDLHHDMTAGMLDIYLSTLNNRMNETMKILTLFASIFIPLTFIAGVYGMNFQYMPELKWHYGYPGILIFMASVAFCMFSFFRRKKLI